MSWVFLILYFEIHQCFLQGYMTRRTIMFSQCQKLIRYVRGATNRCNRLIGKKQIKGEAKRLDYILLCVWRGLRRHQPLFRGSFHQEATCLLIPTREQLRRPRPARRSSGHSSGEQQWLWTNGCGRMVVNIGCEQ